VDHEQDDGYANDRQELRRCGGNCFQDVEVARHQDHVKGKTDPPPALDFPHQQGRDGDEATAKGTQIAERAGWIVVHRLFVDEVSPMQSKIRCGDYDGDGLFIFASLNDAPRQMPSSIGCRPQRIGVPQVKRTTTGSVACDVCSKVIQTTSTL